MTDRVVLGIDAGGSHTRAVVADNQLRVLGSADGAPGAIAPGEAHDAVEAIRETAAEATRDFAPEALVIGAAGAGDPGAAAALRQRLHDLAPRVEVTTDFAVALAAAFGNEPGIVLIAGTGSVAAARLPDGRLARTGGLGPDRGDPGSGYAIAMAAAAAGLIETTGGRRAMAAQASDVCRMAVEGDETARELVASAAAALIAMVNHLVKRFGAGATPTVALVGGLLRTGSPIRRDVVDRLPDRARLHPGTPDPAMGAAFLALQLAAS